jgi:putative transposase
LAVANLAKSVYYYHQSLSQQPDPHAPVKAQIAAIFHHHRGRYGYRRVHLELRNQGCYRNPKTVQKLMGQMSLKSTVRPKRYQSYQGVLGKMAPNQLNRVFRSTAPNQKWVTDVTEFNIKGQKIYLSPMLDLFNQEIIAYDIADHPLLSSVLRMLHNACQRLQHHEKPMVHSDQGWQYQMMAYRQAIEHHGLTQSMSRKGNCFDNAVMENWFGILKTEFFHAKQFHDVESFKQELKDYIHYYNHQRIKQKLKGLSPVQYRTQSLLVP